MDNLNDTQKRLIKAGIDLFSEHGYEAVSTRAITKEANANISAISHYFGSKNGLYQAVLFYVADNVREVFAPFLTKVETVRENGKITNTQAYELLDEYIDLMIDIVVNPAHPEYLQLQYMEQTTPAGDDYPITDELCKRTEIVVSQVLADYWKSKDQFACRLLCRFIVGALVAVGEHPLYIRMAIDVPVPKPLPKETRKYLKDFIINSIKTFRP